MLEAQVAHWKDESERQRKARITEAIIGLVALGLLISFTIWYSAWTQANADKRWCSFLVPLDQRYQKLLEPTAGQPPVSEDSKEFARRLHLLVDKEFNC
jgi:hypothetical protein